MQAAVDQQRFDIMYESAFEILQQQAAGPDVRALGACTCWSGYEQATLPRDTDALAWIAEQLLDALDSGRFASVPDGE